MERSTKLERVTNPFGLLLIIIVSLMAAVLISCSQNPTIDKFEAQLQEQGFEVEREPDPYAGMIKAQTGVRIIVDGVRLEVYRYNDKDGFMSKIVDRGIYGKSAISNGHLLLFERPDHPEWQIIRKTFNNL